MKSIFTGALILLISGVSQAAISNSGSATCTIKQWDKKYFELACDPRAPQVTLRTPAEWVKTALADERPEAGKQIEMTVTSDKLRSWIDMNKKTFAKADGAAAPAPVKKKGAK